MEKENRMETTEKVSLKNENSNKVGDIGNFPVRISLIYAVVGSLWIVVSDLVLGWHFSAFDSALAAEIAKGLMFVAVTTLLIYGLARREVGEASQKMVQKQLDMTERMMNRLLESLGEAVFVVDPATRTIVRCNPAVKPVFGYEPEELMGQKTSILHVSEGMNDRFAEEGEAQLETKGVFRAQYRMRRKDGTTIYTENTVTPMHADLDWRSGVFSIVRDVSKRVEAEQALQERERQYRLLAENTLDLIWKTDMELNFVYVNRAVRSLMGYAPEEFLGSNVRDHCDGVTFQRIQKVVDQQVAAGPDGKGALVRVVLTRKDGSHVEVEARGSINFDENGNPVGVQGVSRDVTEREEAKRKLRSSERRFRMLFERASEGILVTSCESEQIVHANAAMCRMLQYSKSELLKLTTADIHPEESLEDLEVRFLAVAQGLQSSIREVPCTRKDGTLMYADVSATVMTIDGTLCNVGFYRDVTPEVVLRKEKEGLEAQLRQAQKLEALGTLASGIAHEVNNPIMGISGYAELIELRAGDNADVVAHAQQIRKETKRVYSILKNLLQFARADMRESSVPVSVSHIVDDTLALMRTILRHDDIELNVEVPDDLPVVPCRPQQIQQVLLNLVTNARDALNDQKDKSKTKTREISIVAAERHRAGDGFVRITVEDPGCGIPDHVRERLFDPFFTTKEPGKGTGLGLSIVHGIVKEHGGYLEVESEAGQFTRFHVDLPVTPPEAAELNSQHFLQKASSN